MNKILEKLQGGDLRSIGMVDEVVKDILADSTLFVNVFDGMCNPNPVIRMRAADTVEKVTRINPTWLFPFKERLIGEVAQIEQQEVRWHLAQLLSRLVLEENELNKVVDLLKQWIEGSKSNIVKVNSMQSLCDLGYRYPNLKPSITQVIRVSVESGSPAVVSRGKKLLRKLGVKDI